MYDTSFEGLVVETSFAVIKEGDEKRDVIPGVREAMKSERLGRWVLVVLYIASEEWT